MEDDLNIISIAYSQAGTQYRGDTRHNTRKHPINPNRRRGINPTRGGVHLPPPKSFLSDVKLEAKTSVNVEDTEQSSNMSLN